MRRLKTLDVFSAMRLVKTAGVKDEVKRIALITRSTGEFKIEEVGLELILSVVEGLSGIGAEQKFYEFVSGPLEMSVEEIQDMEFLNLLNLLKEYKNVEDQEGWKAFFDSVAAMMR